jgi:hypothetical protein
MYPVIDNPARYRSRAVIRFLHDKNMNVVEIHNPADCVENVGALTSHNPMGLHGLLQG